MGQRRVRTLADLVRTKIGWMDDEARRLREQRADMARALEDLECGRLPGKENRTFALYEAGFLAEVMRHADLGFEGAGGDRCGGAVSTRHPR